MSGKQVLGAFNQGAVPTIACFNQAVTPLGVDLDALIAACRHISTTMSRQFGERRPIWLRPRISNPALGPWCF